MSKPPPPGLLRMALDATEAIVRFVGSGFKTAPEATYRERLQVCSICDHHTRLRCADLAAASPASRRSSCTKTARPGGGRDERQRPPNPRFHSFPASTDARKGTMVRSVPVTQPRRYGGQRILNRQTRWVRQRRRIPDCERLEPRALLVTSPVTGTIASVGDVHETSLSLTGGEMLTIQPVSGSTADYQVAPGVASEHAGQLLSASHDGHSLAVTIPVTGTYRLQVNSVHEQKVFLGSYSIGLSESAFAGTSETEPDDTAATAVALTAPAEFGGTLSSTADVDHYTFTASSGDVVTVKFANLPAGNPSVRLYDPSGVLVTAGTDGNGLAAELAAGGSYGTVVGSDNAAGANHGAYFGSLVVALGACSLTRRPRWRCPRAMLIGAPTLQVVPGAYLSQSPGGAAGLTGGDVNAWLGWYTTQDDWKELADDLRRPRRPDRQFHHHELGKPRATRPHGGKRRRLGPFSVQWDGWITVPRDGTRLSTRSDDASRMWIDVNGDSTFGASPARST